MINTSLDLVPVTALLIFQNDTALFGVLTCTVGLLLS